MKFDYSTKAIDDKVGSENLDSEHKDLVFCGCASSFTQEAADGQKFEGLNAKFVLNLVMWFAC